MHTLLHIVLPVLGSVLYLAAIVTQSIPVLILFLCLAIPLVTRHLYQRIQQRQWMFATFIVCIVLLTAFISYPLFT